LAALLGLATTAAAREYRSHPPLRSLPQPSSRPLAAGPAFFVDAVRGDDQGPGSRSVPWRSLRHAVRQLQPGDTLYLRAGVYFEQVVLRGLGAEGAPITLRAYPAELAIVDGGLRDFVESPATAWEPAPKGVAGEYRSVGVYPGLAEVQGHFADSMVPLHAYRNLADLRSDNQQQVGRDDPFYCGPGAWFDIWSGHIHVRLAPTRLRALSEQMQYRGETDPRKLRLALTGGPRVTLWIEGSQNLRLQDLVLRGGAAATVQILDSHDIELDNLTVYGGRHALKMDRSDRVRVVGSAFRGAATPWASRSSHKYRGIPGILFLTGAALRKSRDLEISHSEFTDGHDGVFLGEVDGVRFHHNLVENFNDDGIFLTSRTTGPREVHIHQNRISRCLTAFAFGWGRGKPNRPGPGVWIYRNVVELLQPVPYQLASTLLPGRLEDYGRVAADHGSPVWEPAFIYHNTFAVRRADPRAYALGWGGHLTGTSRRLFNNLLVQIEGLPTRRLPSTRENFQADGNHLWSVEAGPSFEGELLADYRASALFEASKERYPPGWEAHGRFVEPRFVRFSAAGAGNDYRPAADSPVVDAGITLPEAWPDPLRAEDRGAPDVGALPVGALEPVYGRPRLN
jgi:hypothetical protein